MLTAELTINVSCSEYDPQSGIVTTLVAWQLPTAAVVTASKTGRPTMTWNSTILVQYQTPEGPLINAHRTTSPHFQLSLAVDHVYEITVRRHRLSHAFDYYVKCQMWI